MRLNSELPTTLQKCPVLTFKTSNCLFLHGRNMKPQSESYSLFYVGMRQVCVIKTVIRLHGFHVLVTGFVDVVNNITSKASCLMAQHIFSIFSEFQPIPLSHCACSYLYADPIMLTCGKLSISQLLYLTNGIHLFCLLYSSVFPMGSIFPHS